MNKITNQLIFLLITVRNDYENSKRWLKKSMKYKDYETHMMVTHRADMALGSLKKAHKLQHESSHV